MELSYSTAGKYHAQNDSSFSTHFGSLGRRALPAFQEGTLETSSKGVTNFFALPVILAATAVFRIGSELTKPEGPVVAMMVRFVILRDPRNRYNAAARGVLAHPRIKQQKQSKTCVIIPCGLRQRQDNPHR